MEGALKCVLFPERERALPSRLSVSLSAHQHRRRQQSCLHCGRCPFFDLWDHPYLTSTHFFPFPLFPFRMKPTHDYAINSARPFMYMSSGRHISQPSLKAGTPQPTGLSKGHKRPPPPSLSLASLLSARARSLARSFIVCEIEGCRGIMRFANG